MTPPINPHPEFKLILSDFEWLEGDKKAGRKLRFTFEFSVDTVKGVFRFLQEGWVASRHPKTHVLHINPPFQRVQYNRVWANSRISRTAMDILVEAVENTTYGPKIGTNPFTNEYVSREPKPWEEDPSLPSLFEVRVDTLTGIEGKKENLQLEASEDE